MTLPVPLPEPNRTVYATLRSHSGKTQIAELRHVTEDDVTWRTADDNSELNEMAFDVIDWHYKE